MPRERAWPEPSPSSRCWLSRRFVGSPSPFSRRVSLTLFLFFSTHFQILTPADFALINSLKLAAATEAAANGGGSAAKRKLAVLEANKKHLNTDLDDGFLNEGDIMGPRKKVKENYEERMASIAKGREGRDKFGSAKGKKKEESHSSSTNKEYVQRSVCCRELRVPRGGD